MVGVVVGVSVGGVGGVLRDDGDGDVECAPGAGACVVMDETLAEKKGLKPLGRFLGFAVAGCEPDEMGIGPVFAVPKVLKRLGLTVNDIDLWELNEAFAVQVMYCRDKLGIPPELLNVNGGAIALGHPITARRFSASRVTGPQPGFTGTGPVLLPRPIKK